MSNLPVTRNDGVTYSIPALELDRILARTAKGGDWLMCMTWDRQTWRPVH